MNSQHWTDDVDLLERYVMDRVGAWERRELEQHLETCERCRTAVRQEEVLAEGVRHGARGELKARLRRRIYAEPRRELSWTQVATAVAIVVILIGVGLFNDWFSWYEKKDITDEFRQEGSLPESREETPPPPEMPRPGIEERRGIGKEEPQDFGRRDRGVRPQALEDTKAADGQEPPSEIMQPPRKRAATEDAAGAGEMVQKDLTARREFPALEEKEPELSFTLEGVIVENGRKVPPRTQPSAGEKTELYRTPPDDRRKLAALDSHEPVRIIVQEGARSQTFILDQRSASLLDGRRAPVERTIPATVRKTEEGLWLTIYLDTLVVREDLLNATIEPVGRDSIILSLRGRKIGYRIPGGWLEKLPAKQ